jgi:hypothetical protein
MKPFQSIRDYEEFIYSIKQRFPSIRNSSLIVIRRGTRTAIVQGEIYLSNGYRIAVKERISFDNDQVIIESYGYEFLHNDQKISWYDSQPHPDDNNLKSTFPHHKHILPGIKHNRVPAPNISFDHSNLDFLIQEVESLLEGS